MSAGSGARVFGVGGGGGASAVRGLLSKDHEHDAVVRASAGCIGAEKPLTTGVLDPATRTLVGASVTTGRGISTKVACPVDACWVP